MKTDWLRFWADITPWQEAIIDLSTDTPYTYEAINTGAERLAYFLQDAYNIQKGDRLAVLAQNCIEYIVLFSAAQKIGFVLVPLNYRLTKTEINTLLEDIEPKLLLRSEEFSHLVPDSHTSFALKAFMDRSQKEITAYKPADIDEDDPLFILYTSGSSGKPKGAIYTHKMLFWNSINTQISLKLDNTTTTINCMPPFHTGGWNVLLSPILHAGGRCILIHKFDAATIIECIHHYQCSIFMGVPTMLKMMRDDASFDQIDISCLDYIIVGGEAMSLELIETYQEKNIPIRQGYGMTEVGPNLTSLHHHDAVRKIGSIGKPNMYVDIKIVDENGKEVAQGEKGELLLSGPVVTPGYFKMEEETKNAFTGKWFHTGDVVIMDDEGFLFIVDRIKNMYISGGENVYPAQVEAVLARHPAIHEVAVIGIPDPKWGETGMAFISIKDGIEALSIDDLKEYCTGKLSKYKIPKHLKIVETLPKTDSGKINRKELKN